MFLVLKFLFQLQQEKVWETSMFDFKIGGLLRHKELILMPQHKAIQIMFNSISLVIQTLQLARTLIYRQNKKQKIGNISMLAMQTAMIRSEFQLSRQQLQNYIRAYMVIQIGLHFHSLR